MNENHIRALGVYLYNIEKNLDSIIGELCFNPSKVEPVLHIVKNDVEEDVRIALSHEASSMLEELRSIKHEFGLITRQESSRKRINGALTEIWTTIYDLQPERLECYGPLAEGDEQRLGSVVSRLQELLSEMYSSVGPS